MGDQALAKEFEKGLGRTFGKWKLKKVWSGEGVPDSAPTLICLSRHDELAAITTYSRKNGVLTATGNPELVAEGIALGVGVRTSDGKPRILLNAAASKKEGIAWLPAMFRVAEIVGN